VHGTNECPAPLEVLVSLQATKPFSRADHIGSLLRPASLLEARERYARGLLDASGLRAVEDAAIRAAVATQERVGLSVITDGEFRRENWYADFIGRIPGVEIREGTNPAFLHTAESTTHYVPKNVVTATRLRLPPHPLNVEDFAFTAAATARRAKITIPSPTRLHFHGGRKVVSRDAYPDLEEFFADVVAIYRREIAALEAAGARYLQIDDPVLAYFVSDRMRAEIAADGDDPDERLARYVRLLNDCIAERSPETTIALHVCRGNARSAWISEGGYERIAPAVFGGLNVDQFMLEFDDERSGGFEPLRFVRPGARVVLGLVTTKHGRLEARDALRRRIEEAAAIIPIADLGISPQCGFASIVEGNLLSEDDQWAKLGLVVATAQDVWDEV